MSVYVRRRIAAVLLLVGLAVAVLAIADVGPFENPPTEEERAEAAVTAFFGAASSGDFKSFCSLLTETARLDLTANAARLTGEESGKCAPTLKATLGEVLGGADVDVRQVRVSGTGGAAKVRIRPPDSTAQLQSVQLERIDGEWLITDPGG